jgi:homoserine kinase
MEVCIQVPASTSNFGPGFDCLGAALRLYNRVTLTTTLAAGDGEAVAQPTHPMVEEAAAAYFAETGPSQRRFPFAWQMTGDVPSSRGLGSSVTLRLGVVAGLNALSGSPLAPERVFALCAGLEGHPDNAAPAQFGGFTVAGGGGAESPVLRVAVSPRLHCVLLVPDFEIRTADARRLLPAQVSRTAAVASSALASRITAAFALRHYEALRGAFEDTAFHQPHRLPLIPFLPAVIAAGVAAGALGGFLSGSGSTIICLTLQTPERVAAAMHEAAGGAGRTIMTRIDNRGARIVRTVSPHSGGL